MHVISVSVANQHGCSRAGAGRDVERGDVQQTETLTRGRELREGAWARLDRDDGAAVARGRGARRRVQADVGADVEDDAAAAGVLDRKPELGW
jgi:hypothetical protein